MKMFVGFVLGAVAMAAFAYRKTIHDIWTNRQNLSKGATLVDKVQDAVSAGKDLLNELEKAH